MFQNNAKITVQPFQIDTISAILKKHTFQKQNHNCAVIPICSQNGRKTVICQKEIMAKTRKNKLIFFKPIRMQYHFLLI